MTFCGVMVYVGEYDSIVQVPGVSYGYSMIVSLLASLLAGGASLSVFLGGFLSSKPSHARSTASIEPIVDPFEATTPVTRQRPPTATGLARPTTSRTRPAPLSESSVSLWLRWPCFLAHSSNFRERKKEMVRKKIGGQSESWECDEISQPLLLSPKITLWAFCCNLYCVHIISSGTTTNCFNLQAHWPSRRPKISRSTAPVSHAFQQKVVLFGLCAYSLLVWFFTLFLISASEIQLSRIHTNRCWSCTTCKVLRHPRPMKISLYKLSVQNLKDVNKRIAVGLLPFVTLYEVWFSRASLRSVISCRRLLVFMYIKMYNCTIVNVLYFSLARMLACECEAIIYYYL